MFFIVHGFLCVDALSELLHNTASCVLLEMLTFKKDW
jgi:hypothetical protein